MKYDIQYFIDKFEAIPAQKWTKGTVCEESSNRYCALGHCGVRVVNKTGWSRTEEATALENIYRNSISFSNMKEEESYWFWRINDQYGNGYHDGKAIKYGVIDWLKKEKERLDASNQT